MNPIDYLKSKGFRVTSDPAKYQSGIWGKRDYTVNGYNYDTYCGGYHRAYDLAKKHLAPVPAVCDGKVVAGTSAYGNFGGTVVIANKTLGIQVIYGHLARNLPVKVGDSVKQGNTVGYQSNTNYDNVYMASHLHIQFQKYGYLASERAFVCTGINPLGINVGSGAGPVSLEQKTSYNAAWLWKGKYKVGERTKRRAFPSLKGDVSGYVRIGEVYDFDKLYYNDGHWWIRILSGNAQWFIAVGRKETGVTFKTAASLRRLWGTVTNLDTSGGKEKPKKAL
ncbi:M23 family metallopeptidase [Salinicoccus sp. HZC-1]|uniref:M23 family metallopeptidase n=1 Tax=Salinicoccus sp. HZC-1 TaxID=3385497 RepID=UPI00398B2862